MAGGAGGGKRIKEQKGRRLKEALDEVIGEPPYADGFDPFRVAAAALDRLPDHSGLPPAQARRLRDRFDNHVSDTARRRSRLDRIEDPDASFDPGNPDTIGRLVVIALLAQDPVPLAAVRPTYGSGIYALYYVGEHPAYEEIRGTATPIYVGKADPADLRAATPREQGIRLFGRLADHRKAIRRVEAHAVENEIPNPLRVDDFECRRLVCATNAQLVAERHLVEIFKPVWNKETGICVGFSKHGDSAETRGNHMSTWDIFHPGRRWTKGSPVRDGVSPETIEASIRRHFSDHVPRRDAEENMQFLLDAFRQVGDASSEVSDAAADYDEVVKDMARGSGLQRSFLEEDGEE